MLDQTMKDQLKAYLENLKTDVHLVLTLDDSDTSNKLQALANDIASLNSKVKVIEDQSASERKPIMQVVNPTKETVLTHIQRVERPLELCFEGHRWKDLVRWGIVKEVFDELRSDEKWREDFAIILNINSGGVAPLYINERIRPDFFIAAQNYVSDQHDYLPIPTQERQNNPMIN